MRELRNLFGKFKAVLLPLDYIKRSVSGIKRCIYPVKVTAAKGCQSAAELMDDKLVCRGGQWGATLALRDDFSFWSASQENDTSGKVYLFCGLMS